MSLTYSWKLVSLRKTSAANLNNVVIGTTWQLTGTDEDGVFGIFTGATPFKPSDVNVENFVEFNNLTEETVLGWIQAVVFDGINNYKDHIDNQILKQIRDKKNTVEVVSGNNFPWIVS